MFELLGLAALIGAIVSDSSNGGGAPRQTVLGDLIKAGKNLDTPDFWLDKKGLPTRVESKGVLGIRVVRTDVIIESYLFYMLEYLYNEGLWRGRPVSAENLLHASVSLPA